MYTTLIHHITKTLFTPVYAVLWYQYFDINIKINVSNLPLISNRACQTSNNLAFGGSIYRAPGKPHGQVCILVSNWHVNFQPDLIIVCVISRWHFLIQTMKIELYTRLALLYPDYKSFPSKRAEKSKREFKKF